jgi:N-acetylneuraminic acid mutarotase
VAFREGAPVPRPVAGHATGWVDGKLVLAGGSYWEGGEKFRIAKVQVYDPAANTWAAGPDLPEVMTDGSGVNVGNDFYVLGGFDGERVSQNCYRLVTGPDGWKWQAVAPLPAPRLLGGAAALGGRIYLFGGCADSKTLAGGLNSLLVYDPARPEDGWRERTPLPGAPRCIFGLAAVGGQLVVVGGCTLDQAGEIVNLAEVWRYAPDTDTWTRGTDLPYAERAAGATAFENRYVLLFGGYTGETETGFITTVLAGDIQTDTWAEVGTLLHPMGVTEFMLHEDQLYGAGGEDRPRSRAPWTFIGTIEQFVRTERR